MALRTRLTEKLDIRHPVLLAPMGGTSGGALAAAVSAAGRGRAAALMLGADGVLMGTRFYASDEALAAPAAKARVVAMSGDDTLRTSIFDLARGLDWPSDFTGRVLRNRFSETWHGREAALVSARDRELPAYAAAAAAGDYDTAVIHSGEVIDLIEAAEPAGAIVDRIVREAEAAFARRFG